MIHLEGVRILHILGDSAYGGGSKIILALASKSVESGAQVTILTTDERMAREALLVGASVTRLDAIQRSIRPIRDLVGLARLVRYLKRERFDIVHTHTSKAGFVGRLSARITGVPFIVHTLHGLAFHDRSPKPAVMATVLAERLSSACCHRVVSVSHTHYNLARRLRMIPQHKLQTIPNGIAASSSPDQDHLRKVRAELGAIDGTPLILCHGRLAPQKGIEDLLDGLSMARIQGTLPPRLIVAIAGDGPIRSELIQRSVDSNLTDIVRFLGFRTDIDALLESADMVVLPSHREGLSVSLMEAMSRGCLVLASDIPNNLELVKDGHNGVTFVVGNPATLATSLTAWLGNLSAGRKLGQRARLDIERDHNLDSMQRAYLNVYVAGLKNAAINDLGPTHPTDGMRTGRGTRT